MPSTRDVIIVGGGHNGLITAFYLARAGFKPLVLERRPVVGGAAITDEIHPGFRVSTLAHTAGPLRADVVRDMQLERHGLRIIAPDPRVFAPSPDGRALFLHEDPAKSALQIRRFSARDAAQFPELHRVLGRLGALGAGLMAITPPSIDQPSTSELWALLQTARKFRRLGKKDGYRLLRWGPMAVADLVAEWFETELLRATLAARGIFGTFCGPWSAGSGAVLLLHAAMDPHTAGSAAMIRGGMGALTRAMATAACEAGAEIRTSAAVSQITVQEGHATGVVLAGTGEEIRARTIVSNADPRRTFLSLVDPIHLEPDFLTKMRNYRSIGTVGKVNLALSSLPRFTALGSEASGLNDAHALAGRIHIGPDIDYLERAFDAAKYGDFSKQPYLDITIPSISDPTLAPAGAHVMSVQMQFAPYKLKGAGWNDRRDQLGDTVIRTIAEYAPGFPGLVLNRQIITPVDLEQEYGLTGGHIYHGEMALDQLFTMRPLLGWAQYRTPIEGLYLCGAGTHPGGGVTGAPGANASREIVRDLKARRQ